VRRAVWILAVLLSHWRRHPMQLATLLIGLISATALWSGVQALNQQARSSYDRAAAVFGGSRTAMLVGRGATIPQSLFVKLRRAGWPVSPVLEGRVQIGGRSYRLLGIEPVTLPTEVGNAPTIGRTGLQAFMTPPGQTLVAPETLADLDLAEGTSPEMSGGMRLPPLQAQPELVGDVLVVDIGIAQKLLNKPDQISRLLIGKAMGPRQSLASVAGDTLHLVEPDAESDLERLTDSFHLNLTAFGLLSFLVGLFIVN
jgi:putative ABC transport system permease protein